MNTAKKPRSQVPRPHCQEPPACPVYQQPTGCGFLDANTPCMHPYERHRFPPAAPGSPVDPQLSMFEEAA